MSRNFRIPSLPAQIHQNLSNDSCSRLCTPGIQRNAHDEFQSIILFHFVIRFSSCFRPNPSSAMTHMTGAHFCYFRTMPGTKTFSCAQPIEVGRNMIEQSKSKRARAQSNHRQGQRMRSSACTVLSSHLDRVWTTTAPEPTTCAFMFGPGRDSRLSFTDDRIVVVSNNSDGISSREDLPVLGLLYLLPENVSYKMLMYSLDTDVSQAMMEASSAPELTECCR